MDLYLERVKDANTFLKEALTELYDFCPLVFLDSVEAMHSYAGYYEHLKGYDESQFYVLQFGNAVQFRSDPPRKIKRYDRDIWGIYRTDGKNANADFSGQAKRIAGKWPTPLRVPIRCN